MCSRIRRVTSQKIVLQYHCFTNILLFLTGMFNFNMSCAVPERGLTDYSDKSLVGIHS